MQLFKQYELILSHIATPGVAIGGNGFPWLQRRTPLSSSSFSRGLTGILFSSETGNSWPKNMYVRKWDLRSMVWDL